ncbi:hypothetical protein QBC32DRAFT_392318 [Pseudoneurospora amorphoporcata]|uniref:Uncharacterized protein n=1 Tax=Pseudoneurospora amorphoporcata TaxID=241081 RepID=A0AAN6NUW2_9PEZI|nr:hypothetical protein QBC32DRAFT_392318 [Pseudoneurospora amorphoporcata]
MPPKPAASAAGAEAVYTINGVPLTPSDLKMICGVLTGLTAPLQTDLDAAAAASGYTIGSFKKMWPTLKKKVNIDSVGANKQVPTPAGDDSGEPVATPKKTPGDGARGRGRSSKKADAITMVDSGGPSPLTPGVPAGMDALSVDDAATETPDTPSKSTFAGNTVSSKKRTAAEQADADAITMEEETPAKKKAVTRKPRITAKQKREAEAAAAAAAEAAAAEALAAESAFFYDHEHEAEPENHDPDVADAGRSASVDSIDAILEGDDGVSSPSRAEVDVFTDACEI